MHGLTHYMSQHSSSPNNQEAKSSSSSSGESGKSLKSGNIVDVKLIAELTGLHKSGNEGKLYLNDRQTSRGSVSSTYSYGSSNSYGSSHGSASSNYGSGYPLPNSVYNTIHGNGSNSSVAHYHHPLQSIYNAPSNHYAHYSQHHPLHHHPQQQQQQHHHQQHPHRIQHQLSLGATNSGAASPTSLSPTGESDKQHHHHHSIQEMIRYFGRRLGHIRRQSESQDTPKVIKEEEFRNRSQSLDGSARPPTLETDCETTYRIYESILRQGAIRRGSLDPGTRRLSLGTPAIPHRASDACLDPVHAAILFRDARGLPVVDPFLEKVSLSDLGEKSKGLL